MIKFSDIQDAFFFVSSAAYGLHTAILSKDTGQMYWRSEEGDLDEASDRDLPSDRCVEIPHRNDLEQVQKIFGRRGAYAAFKNLLELKGLLQSWYEFEYAREEQALRQWCNENELELSG